MEAIGWIAIGTALFLGACALFVPYLAEIVKRKAFAPKLKIRFELAEPYCHKTSCRSQRVGQQIDTQPIYYFRFQVANEGKTQARLCEAVLENLWIYDSDNKPQLYQNFSPVNLSWVGTTGNEFIGINPKRKVYCDIGHISSRRFQTVVEQRSFVDILGYEGAELRFVLDLRRIFYSQPNCLPPGKYVLQLALYSENAGHQTQCFEISWSGKWSDNLDEMFREVVIQRVRCPV